MSSTNRTPLFIPITLLIIAIISIQVGSSLAIKLYGVVGPEGIIALRLLISAIIFIIIFKPWRVKISAGNWRSLILYGVCLGGMSFTLYQSFKYIPQGIAIAIEFIGPLTLTFILSRSRTDFIWAILVVIGLYLLILHGAHFNGEMLDWRGIAWAAITGLLWALYIIFGKKSGASYGINTVTLGTIVAVLIFFPIGLIEEGANLFTKEVLMIGFVIAILSSAIPYALEIYSMNHMPTKTFGVLTSAEPVFGALSGMLILTQNLSLAQWIGLIIVIIASIGATTTASHENKKGVN